MLCTLTTEEKEKHKRPCIAGKHCLYNNDEISWDERYFSQDNGYSVIENNGRETFALKINTANAINGEQM